MRALACVAALVVSFAAAAQEAGTPQATVASQPSAAPASQPSAGSAPQAAPAPVPVERSPTEGAAGNAPPSGGDATTNQTKPPPPIPYDPPPLWVTILACVVAFMAMLGVRWNMVARPAREQLAAEIDAVEARRAAAALSPAQDTQVGTLLKQARERLDELDMPWHPRWQMNVLFWSRGREDSGFQLLHDAKQVLVGAAPAETLRVELEDAMVQLRQVKTPEATALAESIDAELKRSPIALEDRAGAALREALSMIERGASQAKADLDAASAPQSTATADEMALLARRLLIDLAPHRQAALESILQHALAAPACGMPIDVLPSEVPAAGAPAADAPPANARAADLPPEYRALLTHTSSVFLRRAEAARADLQAACDQAGPSVERWRAVLTSYTKGYVEPAQYLRVRIEAALGCAPLHAPERWRALAREAKNLLYASEDAAFSWTASWHKKTTWLCFVGLALICVLAATLRHEFLFTLGALGGLIGRMQRGLLRDKAPVDYGQSWNTLFLSPVVGALAGWGGVLLVAMAVQAKLLGELFKGVTWDEKPQVLVLGIALLLGLSERFFVSIVQGIQGKAGVTADEGDTATTKTETATQVQRATTTKADGATTTNAARTTTSVVEKKND
jgi:hypothetical protein